MLATVCFFSFFINLEAHDVDLMEARNFVTARETAVEGRWLIPTMNEELRIAKPPLPTWITAAARIAGGNVDNVVMMRLPAAMVATIMVLAMWGLMSTLSTDRWLPFVTALILATSLLVIDMGRRGSWDIYCHSFMLAGIWTLSAGVKKAKRVYGGFALAGILFSFSFMSKGPVAFYALLLPFLIAYISAFGLQKISYHWKGLLLAFGICCFLSGIWPLLIYARYPELSAHVAFQETSAWGNRHTQPIYFYAHFAVYSGIWAVTVIAGLITPYAQKRIGRFFSFRFIIIWLIATLILLTVIPEKKERYLLPAMIPMAILAGCLWRNIFAACTEGRTTTGDRRWSTLHTVFLSIASLTMPVFFFRYGVASHTMSTPSAIGWSIVFISLAATMVILQKKRLYPAIFISSLVLMCLMNLTALPLFFQSPLYKKHPDTHPLRAIRQIDVLNGLKVYSTGRMNIKSIWDAGVAIQQWDYGNQPLPLDNLPVAVISTVDPTQGLLSEYHNEIDVNVLGKYTERTNSRGTVYFVTLISPLKSM